jgi:hypothetical protein
MTAGSPQPVARMSVSPRGESQPGDLWMTLATSEATPRDSGLMSGLISAYPGSELAVSHSQTEAICWPAAEISVLMTSVSDWGDSRRSAGVTHLMEAAS